MNHRSWVWSPAITLGTALQGLYWKILFWTGINRGLYLTSIQAIVRSFIKYIISRQGYSVGIIHWNGKYSDTHCFGANFWLISFTSEECTLAPFLPEYIEQVNLPICTGITALKINSEDVVILEFMQGLWFGNIMQKSVIKPNQCQKFGIHWPTKEVGNLVIVL